MAPAAAMVLSAARRAHARGQPHHPPRGVRSPPRANGLNPCISTGAGFPFRWAHPCSCSFWTGAGWRPLALPTRYPAVDYFPLIPWFGVVLLGVWFGNWFYANNRRLISLPDWGNLAPIRGLRWLGRHSLPIYLVHQPLILLVLMLLGIVSL
ncbi:MAG: heparan-alpha-glucosaminide N-acetyltransferase domain-containing protein [Rhodoblastus sp.]